MRGGYSRLGLNSVLDSHRWRTVGYIGIGLAGSVRSIAIDLAHPLGRPALNHWFGTDDSARSAESLHAGARISVLIPWRGRSRDYTGHDTRSSAGYLVAGPTAADDGYGSVLGFWNPAGAGPDCSPGLEQWQHHPGSEHCVHSGLSCCCPSTVLSIREREFIEASRSAGDSSLETIVRHVLRRCCHRWSCGNESVRWPCVRERIELSRCGRTLPRLLGICCQLAPTWTSRAG